MTPSHPSPVLASAKSPTTPDVTLGIQSAIKLALEKAGSSVDLTGAEAVNIGTTHFVNALIERNVERLDRVAVIRCASSKSLVFWALTDALVTLADSADRSRASRRLSLASPTSCET